MVLTLFDKRDSDYSLHRCDEGADRERKHYSVKAGRSICRNKVKKGLMVNKEN